MRLLTFQNKKCLKVLEKGEWHSTRADRLKCIDYDYVGEDEETYPIYTFASFGYKWEPYFSLVLMSRMFNHLAGFMGFDFDDRVMIELEVPESFILNMKSNNDWFEQKCDENDPDKELRRKDSRYNYYWVKRDLSKGNIYKSDYLKHMRENRNTEFEAVIPCIKKEHIVSIREFKCEGGTYDTTWCYPIYENKDLCPLWFGKLGLHGDGYIRLDEDTDADLISEINKLKASGKVPFVEYMVLDKQGANQVPGYFTLAETYACGDSKMQQYVKQLAELIGLEKDKWDTLCMSTTQKIVKPIKLK